MKKTQRAIFAAAMLFACAAPAPAPGAPPTAGRNSVHAPLLRKRRPAPQSAAAVKWNTTVTYQVPVLTVFTAEDHIGNISYHTLTFTRERSTKPLRIDIIDDTPGGSGETIRNSVWLAAITAAMLRNDTMQGVTISVEFSGNIDGPSAGAVTCLAILSAMDGLELPKDFAMTGTILPDGTIGVVGGVPGKMRAAAKAGAKRIFVPGFALLEKTSRGETVMLQRLAEELNVELCPVENIEEAYAKLHRKPYRKYEYVNVREMTRLPRNIEDILLSICNELEQKIDKKVAEKSELKKVVIFDDYVLSPTRAKSFLQEGKCLPAALQFFRTWQAWQAVEDATPVLEKFATQTAPIPEEIKYLREYHLRKRLSAFRSMLESHGKKLAAEKERKTAEFWKTHYKGNAAERAGSYPYKDGLTEITAQLEQVDQEPMFQSKLAAATDNVPEDHILAGASLDDLEKYWKDEKNRLLLLHLINLDNNALHEFLGRLGGELPQLRANRHAAQVERLFFLAASSTQMVVDQTLNEERKALDYIGDARFKKRLFKKNPRHRDMEVMNNMALIYHQIMLPRFGVELYDAPYHLQASLKAQVSSFVMSSAMMVVYGPDRESSNDFIPQLLNNARESAIKNITECTKAGIPCLQPICDFEIAEFSRYNTKDPLIPLTAYWRAALYSKALLMSFKPETDNL